MFGARIANSRCNFIDDGLDIRWKSTSAKSGFYGSAGFMPEHNDKARTQMFCCVFDASKTCRIDYITGYSDNKKLAQGLVEHQFRRNARIRTSENGRKRL